MENKLIYSTRKTNKRYVISNILVQLVAVLLVEGWLMSRIEEYSEYYIFYRDTVDSLTKLCVILAIVFIVELAYHCIVLATHLDVYDDHVEGSGLVGLRNQTFKFKMDQITSISTTGGFLNIQASPGLFVVITTTSGSQKILTSKDRANAILAYWNLRTDKE